MDIFARKHFQDSRASSFLKYLSIIIWLKAGLNYVINFGKKVALPLLDITALFGGLLLISEVWARYYFGMPDYYASAPLTFNFIVYTLIWFVFILFGGGYDQKISLVKLLRNILLGTLIVLAFYGLLSPAYRSSRAIIVLAAAYALLVIPLFRFFLGPMLGSCFLGVSSGKRIIVLAHEKEASKIKSVLESTNNNFQSLERLPVNVSSYELREIIQLRNIDEIISNVRDVGMARIIELMSELGSLVSFKITGDESLGIIGSQSKNTSGEIYTLEINYDIQSESSRRNKRAFDILVSILALLVFPLALLSKTGRFILKNIPEIFLGNKTLLGYSGSHADLPELRAPVLFISDQERTSYAKHYTVWKDFRYLWKAIVK